MKRLYCVLEGGGAKGLAHVGALAALEESEAAGEITIAGYAGTSAGAIVATLASVGCSADDMLDAAAGKTILDMIDLDPSGDDPVPKRPAQSAVDLFGPAGWQVIATIRRFEKQRWLIAVKPDDAPSSTPIERFQ